MRTFRRHCHLYYKLSIIWAFYGLQCAGLCAGGVALTVSAHMFNVAIQPILTYGCTTLNFTLFSVKELDKVQAKLLKSALGLPNFCHNTPLLQALKVKKIDNLLTGTTTITDTERTS